MRDNFAACLRETLAHEGGWADHPKDPGGATMRGVTLATYRRWKPGATKADLRAITDAELRTIYRDGYWNPVRGDDLPSGLDLVAFDAAVNSGPSRSAKWLQGALRVTADGKIGPATIAAAKAADAALTINRALDARLTFLRGLKTWGTFGRGWQRRVDEVRAFALHLAQDAPKPAVLPRPVDLRAPKPPENLPKTSPPMPSGVVGPIALAIIIAIAAFVIFGG